MQTNTNSWKSRIEIRQVYRRSTTGRSSLMVRPTENIKKKQTRILIPFCHNFDLFNHHLNISIMGPVLFLFVNDLPSVLDPSTYCRLFADDCLIYRSINSMDDKVILVGDLDSLFAWGQT
jgi:hypothetical protein